MSGPINRGNGGRPVSRLPCPDCGKLIVRQCAGHVDRDDGTRHRCHRSASHGTTVCTSHGAAAPQVKRKAAERVAQAKALAESQLLGLPVATTAEAALQDELDRAEGHMLWYWERVIALADPDALIWGETKRTERAAVGEDGEPYSLVTTESAAAVNMWLQLYHDERKRRADVGKAMLAAGVAERQVRLSEAQGDLAAAIWNAALERAGLGDVERARVLGVLPAVVREFKAIEGGAA